MNGVHLRKYGVATTVNFELFEVDGVDFRVDATFAAGDVTVMKDEGAEANVATLPTDEGKGYSVPLSATEMQAARVVIYLVDQTATKVWLDKAIVIETYGNASAQHAFDLDSASVTLPTIPANWITAAGINADAITAAKIASGAIDADALAANAITAAKIASDAITAAKIAASALDGKGDWNVGKTGYALTQAFPTNFADLSIAVTTGEIALPTIPANWITAAGIAASALDGKGDWNVGKTGYALTVSDWATAANVATALTDIHLDHLFAVDYDPATPPGVATAWANEMVEDDAGVTRFTVNALENAPSGSGASAASIADAVWDELQADHVIADSFGVIASEIATVDTLVDGIQTDLDNATDGLGAIKTAVDAIPTTPMRGTDSAATAANLATAQADLDDIQTRLPAALSGGRMAADTEAINGNTSAAVKLAVSADSMLIGTVDTGVFTPTTTEFEADDIAEATADHMIGRKVIFTSGVLQYQATSISDYALSGANGHFTVVALTEAPGNNDTFIIV